MMQQQQLMVDTTCGSLLRELQHIWDEVGESDSDRDMMLLQLEQECLEVYRRKVDHASHARAQLHKDLANAEAEYSALLSALGESPISLCDKCTGTLKEQLATIKPHLEALQRKKEDRAKQFVEVRRQIAHICGEIAATQATTEFFLSGGDQDLTLRRLEECNAQLQTLQRERNQRLHRVSEYVNVVHELCTVLGMDSIQILADVHPSLVSSTPGQTKNISNVTIEGLAQTIHSLQEEKRVRLQKLQELGAKLLELWNLMDTPVEEQQLLQHITRHIAATQDEITIPGTLSSDTIAQAQMEVDRLDTLKASRMKELVVKRRLELEDICRCAHMEPDANTTEEKLIAMVDSGIVDPTQLLSQMEKQIVQAKQGALTRKEILEKMEKWMSACEEEGWLEDYNKDENRFASKGAHLNLKRAERARAAINKLPAMVEMLILKTKAWEDDRGVPFMFDGVRLLSMLDEYNYLRQEKDEEKRRLRDQKKIQEQLITEQETLFGSKPSPIKTTLSSKKAYGGSRPSLGGTTASQPNRRLSLGTALMQPVTPEFSRPNGVTTHSHLGASMGKDTKRERSRPAAALNYVALNKDEMAGLTSTGGRSAAAVAVGRGQQQQQVVQAPALRQPLSPVVMSVTQQQIYVEDSGNRLQVSNNNKASSFAKRSMTGTSPPTSSPHPRLQGSENTTPMHSFNERRFSSIIGQSR
ncbi:hypothetical protein CY35_01G047700 [Sphagnum magellanicum]|nr:hypothetical protein CY35_01G047700 [Sphagnum magellanicum]